MTRTWIARLGEYGHRIIGIWQKMDAFDPWFSLAIFTAASFLMIWRLGVMERKGLEGTVLGTLVMPYASGFSNLIFAYIMGRTAGEGALVLENCMVNNVTNLTLLIGLPALIWGLNIFPEKNGVRVKSPPRKVHRLNHLSLLLTLLAAIFFTGILWALSRDGILDTSDGLVLVGLFVFWQIFHVFDVLKNNIQRGRSLQWSLIIDILLVLIGGYAVYGAIDSLITWIPKTGSGLLVFGNLGWLSGTLMVIPNALPAFYYARAGRADVVYSSQIGDGHICIPMCIGLFSLFSTIKVPATFNIGVLIILCACGVHFIFLSFLGRMPRIMGLAYTSTYGYFIYTGLLQ